MVDFVPLLLFGGAYYFYDIYIATATLLVAMTAVIALHLMLKKEIHRMLWVSYFLVLIFGGATLVLQDIIFLQWKPTILTWSIGLILVGGELIAKRSLLASLFSGFDFHLPNEVWRRLSLGWALGMFLKGGLNLYFALWHSEAVWVSFKIFGQLGLSLLYTVITLVYLRKFLITQEADISDQKTSDHALSQPE